MQQKQKFDDWKMKNFPYCSTYIKSPFVIKIDNKCVLLIYFTSLSVNIFLRHRVVTFKRENTTTLRGLCSMDLKYNFAKRSKRLLKSRFLNALLKRRMFQVKVIFFMAYL